MCVCVFHLTVVVVVVVVVIMHDTLTAQHIRLFSLSLSRPLCLSLPLSQSAAAAAAAAAAVVYIYLHFYVNVRRGHSGVIIRAYCCCILVRGERKKKTKLDDAVGSTRASLLVHSLVHSILPHTTTPFPWLVFFFFFMYGTTGRRS